MVKDYGMCSCGGRIHPQWFFGKKYLECAKCGNPDKNAEQEDGELLLVEQTLSMFGLTVAEVVEQNIAYKSKKPYGTAQVVIDKYTRELYQNPDKKSMNHFHNSFGAYASQLKNFNKWVRLINSHSRGGSSGPDGRCVFIVSLLINRETGEVLRSYQGVESKNAEQEEDYFVFADGTTMMRLTGETDTEYVELRWSIPYSQIRDYVNEWTDNLKSDQEWREGDGPYHVAYDFAHSKSAPDIFTEPFGEEYMPPFTTDWRKDIEDAIISRLRTYDGFPTSVTYDLDEPMTKAEIRSFLTGIPSWKLTKRAESNPYAILGCAGKCPRCEGLVSMKPHGQYCEHCKARGIITYLIDMGDGRLKYDAEEKKLPPVEKAEISGIASGATMEGLEMLAAEEPPEKDDPLESWMEDFDAEDTDHPSLYWFIKGEIMERQREQGKVTENDLAEMVEIVATKAPLWMIDKGMREAERLGDRGPWEILKMAAINRIILEDMDDDSVFSERLGEYRAEEVVMIECPHCYEFGDGEIPADIHYDPGDRWEPPSLDVNSWETCEWCEGTGEVTEEEAEGIPAWDWDILEPDEPDYDRWDAEESNGDKQLELALKRTQMSALRTGLSVLTFGIVILSTFTGWNFWTNKKQEQQISDIMGLV